MTPPAIPSKSIFSLKNILISLTVLLLLSIGAFYYVLKFTKPTVNPTPVAITKDTVPPLDTVVLPLVRDSSIFTVGNDVKIVDYFTFIDSVCHSYDSILPYKLTEYILVRSNPYIMDTLVNTDYDRMKLRDTFIYDQKLLVILKKGDVLKIPTLEEAKTIKAKIAKTRIDINIPEFKLRVIEGEDTIYTCAVRVGQNKIRYLSEVGRDVDLRTRVGKGFIAFNYKKDYFVDPVEGKRFTETKRDDGKTTLMPLQPWLEPKMEGQRWGQLIHPTTNLKSVGKAYSNGCIGTREGDIWRIYYYAPVGTKVAIRYNLKVRDAKGNALRLKDIYSAKSRVKE